MIASDAQRNSVNSKFLSVLADRLRGILPRTSASSARMHPRRFAVAIAALLGQILAERRATASRILGTGLEWKSAVVDRRDWPALANASRAYPRTGGHLMLQTLSGRCPLVRAVAIAGVTMAFLQGTPADAQKRDVELPAQLNLSTRTPDTHGRQGQGLL